MFRSFIDLAHLAQVQRDVYQSLTWLCHLLFSIATHILFLSSLLYLLNVPALGEDRTYKTGHWRRLKKGRTLETFSISPYMQRLAIKM